MVTLQGYTEADAKKNPFGNGNDWKSDLEALTAYVTSESRGAKYEDVLAQTAITYPTVTVNTLTGETIKAILEDVADNLFNPYYQQGGDMVRVGGLQYSCDPNAAMGARIGEMRLDRKPVDAGKRYKVAGWAPVAEEAIASGGEPVWELMGRYLKAQKTIAPRRLNQPKLVGVEGNPGIM